LHNRNSSGQFAESRVGPIFAGSFRSSASLARPGVSEAPEIRGLGGLTLPTEPKCYRNHSCRHASGRRIFVSGLDEQLGFRLAEPEVKAETSIPANPRAADAAKLNICGLEYGKYHTEKRVKQCNGHERRGCEVHRPAIVTDSADEVWIERMECVVALKAVSILLRR
jgi:hypothetical protein